MKLKVKRDRASGGRVLVLEGDKGDELDYVDAERLQRGDLESFLPFEYEKTKKTYRFTYRIGACVGLEDMLRKPFGPMQFRSLITSLLRMVQLCEGNELSRLRVMFETDYVFFDPNAQALRFAYVPLRLFSSPAGDVTMLEHICETAIVPDYDRNLSWAILDYARRTAVLTSVDFEGYLREQGLYSNRPSAMEFTQASMYDTDKLDTRTSHGWDFVRSAQREKGQTESREGHRFLVVRMADKSSFSLGNGAFTLGRDENCAIVLADTKGISRKHARITVADDACTITDLKSTNGVFVNGLRIAPNQPTALQPGDRFELAREEFELL